MLLLAALDDTGTLDVLRRASDDPELLDLAPAERLGIVQVDDDHLRVWFRRAATRRAVIALSTWDERRRAHRALAAALGEHPERRAWHLAHACVEPDEAIADLLETVAGAAIRRSDAVGAVTALVRAADLSPLPADRARRLARAAIVGRAGSVDDAVRVLAEAERADPDFDESLAAAVTTSHVLLADQGDVDTAHRLLVAAMARRPDHAKAVSDGLTEALEMLLHVCWLGGRPELWEPFEAALTCLGPSGPESLVLCHQFFGDPVRAAAPALARLDLAVAGLHEEVDPAHVVSVVNGARFVDRLSVCRQILSRMVHDGRAGRPNMFTHAALIGLATDAYLTGRWGEADHLLDEVLCVSQALGYHQVWPVQGIKALLAAARGDVATTGAMTDAMAGWAEPRRMYAVRWYCRHAKALAALGQGEFELAFQHAAGISSPGTFAPYVPHALWVAMDLVEAAVHTNRHAEAVAHVAAMRDQGIAGLSPRLALLAGASAAMATPDRRAFDLFEESLALPDIASWPFDLARVQLAYGSRLRRSRARVDARLPLSAALDTFQWLGARPWVTRAVSELRATGLPSVRSTAGPAAALTPQQYEIAGLAAAGMTNKEIGERMFLSHRTVSTHLQRIFPKLGITSRSALRDALASARPGAPQRDLRR